MNMLSPNTRTAFAEMIKKASVEPQTDMASLAQIDEIFDALQALDDEDADESDMLFPLSSIIKKFVGAIKTRGVSHSFTTREIAAWITLEVIATGVSADDVASWLTHVPTLDEIVFGEDSSSLYRRFCHRKDKNNRRYFRSLLRKNGFARRRG